MTASTWSTGTTIIHILSSIIFFVISTTHAIPSCETIENCQASCQGTLDNLRGASRHHTTESIQDKQDSCRLGCCLRVGVDYSQCSIHCMTYARSGKQLLDFNFKRCNEGCDFKCRWKYTLVDIAKNQDSICSGDSFKNIIEYVQEISLAHVQQRTKMDQYRQQLSSSSGTYK